MSEPTTALIVILTFVALRPFFELPDAKAKAAALKRGGYTANVKAGCAYMLMIPALLSMWWWYALGTDQILLGVIPTVASVMTILAAAVERSAQKAQR